MIDAVNVDRGNSYFDMIIEDCIGIIKQFDEVLVVFVHRSTNNVPHLLAKATYCSRVHCMYSCFGESLIYASSFI